MLKKLLSVLLTLAMLLSMIPAGFAADIEIVEEPAGADAPGGPLDEIVIDDTVGADAPGGPLADGNIIASGECGENLTWTLDEQGTLTISGTGDMWGYSWNTTPWNEYRSSIVTAVIEEGVTSIGSCAFYGCERITAVSIPDTVTKIEYSAFSNCRGLLSISIPESVTEIGGEAFWVCSSLSSIEIPAGVNSIGGSAFTFCYGLNEINVAPDNQNYCSVDGVLFNKEQTILLAFPGARGGSYAIPEGITAIAEAAFWCCKNLTAVTLPDSVTTIGADAFRGCEALKAIDIPDSVTSIGMEAFQDCTGLESVTLPNGLTAIYEETFCNCPSLKEVTIPETVTHIDSHTFAYCGLTSLTIPSSVKSLGWNTFAWCSDLKELTISEGLTEIGESSFGGCRGLTQVTLPKSLQTLGYLAFENCSNLRFIYFDGSAPTFYTDSFRNVEAKVYYPEEDESWTEEVRQNYGGKLEWYSYKEGQKPENQLPENACGYGLTWILEGGTLTISGVGDLWGYGDSYYSGTHAPWYQQRENIHSLVLENGVTGIGSFAFAGCGNLESVTMPAGLTVIGQGAFSQCYALIYICFAGSAPTIGSNSFNGVNALAYYPEEDESWTEEVRLDYGGKICWESYPGGNMPEPDRENACGYHVRWLIDDNGVLRIYGSGDMWDYKINQAPWQSQKDQITGLVVEDGVTRIGEAAFWYCYIPGTVTIPASVTSVGDSAFTGTKLTAIEVDPDSTSLCSVDGVLFNKDRTKLIAFPGAKGGDYAIPEGVAELAEDAFRQCDAVRSVRVPSSVEELDCVFFQCAGLQYVFCCDGVSRIIGSSFCYCPSLVSVRLPASITSLQNAFSHCYQLREIIFAGRAPDFNSYSFDGITATAYYPENDPSWTEDVMQDYGGTITWVPYTALAELADMTEDYTKGSAAISEGMTLTSGETVFTVSSEDDRPVLVAVKNGDEYTVLKCTTDKNGIHRYTAELGPDSELVIAFKGDVNLDGTVKSSEVTMIKRAIAGTYNFKNALAALTADINGDGTIKSSDATMLARSIAGTYTIKW